jgi:hypothetical protein
MAARSGDKTPTHNPAVPAPRRDAVGGARLHRRRLGASVTRGAGRRCGAR